jgi:hypothetical protein
MANSEGRRSTAENSSSAYTTCKPTGGAVKTRKKHGNAGARRTGPTPAFLDSSCWSRFARVLPLPLFKDFLFIVLWEGKREN